MGRPEEGVSVATSYFRLISSGPLAIEGSGTLIDYG